MEYILSILIFFPAVAAAMGFIVNKDSIRMYAITVTAIEFFLSCVLWYSFDSTNSGMQFMEFVPVIAEYGIAYNLGVDGISLFLVIMTTFMTMIAVIGLTETKDLKNMLITVLFLEMTMVGVFVALDAIIFYLFWELSLVPMLYIIGAWGGNLRIYASVKFFLYTFFGSLIMLVGMLYLAYVYYSTTGSWSFALADWNMLLLPYNMQLWLFIAFFAGFAIKVPMIPFHTWLPYAHGQAPTIGSVILAAVLLKMGTYGFIRFSLPLFPDASVAMMIPMATLGLIAIIYTAMVAYAQEDMKQVIAYSSVSHMGVIILGTFALNVEGIGGSIFLMISHGIVSGALFMLVGVLYDRRHTKMIAEFGGIASIMPKYALIFGIMLMASVGLPLTIGFVGEFLSLLGFFRVSPVMALLAGTTIILGAVYMLVLYKKVFFGPLNNENNKTLVDVKGRELAALVPLVALVVFFGVYPKPILEPVDASVKQLVQTMYVKSITPNAKETLAQVNSIGEEE
ncbi:MAG: NADH-quinone oxidoreductase subunit M [Arcobacteraceae bacterium]|jgi:NADH-quinone oxidoreductase subunit M|nr:NADH-quinone oxidoreductase subunit M [Arcobacteraceae bacterium]MDY0364658.1 NADH-quinone oxidoreductase subunit M [Arcobacteraceae bacterium]